MDATAVSPFALEDVFGTAQLAELLDSLSDATGARWTVQALDAPGMAEDVSLPVEVEGRPLCLLRASRMAGPPPDERAMRLARSLAGMLGAGLAHHLAQQREQQHRIATEAALADYSKRLHLLVDYLPVLIHAHGEGNRYVFWNKECERVTGYTAERVMAPGFSPMETLFGFYDNPLEIFADLHDGPREYRDKEVHLRCADGSERVLAWTNISPRCPIPGWSSWEVAVDITRLKQAEAAQQDQLRLMESLFEAMPTPVFVKDLSLRYTHCNSAFAAFVGRPAGEILGLRARYLWDEAHATAMEEHDRQVLDRLAWSRWEGAARDLAGVVRDIQVDKAPYADHDGSPRGLICVLSDQTRRKREEQKLRDAKAFAEDASQAKSRFLANITHELRTPLNGVMGVTELLLADETTEERRELLEMVRKSAANLLRVVNDLLDLASLEMGAVAIHPQPCDVRKLLENLFKLFAVQAHWKNLEFHFHFQDDLPARCLVDTQRLKQALSNLFWNALKFTESGGVTVTVAVADRLADSAAGQPPREDSPAAMLPLHISIQDTGVGIAPEQQQQIFEPFILAEDVFTKQRGGAGLGLSISRKLAELMGGRLWVESAPGEGSVFHMLAPVQLDADAD